MIYIYTVCDLKTGKCKTIELDRKIGQKGIEFSIKYDKIKYTLVGIKEV